VAKKLIAKKVLKEIAKRTKEINKRYPDRATLLKRAKELGIDPYKLNVRGTPNLARRVATEEFRNRPRQFQIKPRTSKQLAELKRIRAEKFGKAAKLLAKGGKGLAVVGKPLGKVATKVAAPIHAVTEAWEAGKQMGVGVSAEEREKIRREALEEYSGVGKKHGVVGDIGTAVYGGVLDPARAASAFLQTFAGKGESPVTQEIDEYIESIGAAPTGKTTAQLRAERIARGESLSFSEGLRRDIASARRRKYAEDLSGTAASTMSGGNARFFYGLADDPEFEETDLSAIPETDFYKDKYNLYRDQQAAIQEEMAATTRRNIGTKETPNIVSTPKQFFTEADRKIFLKAAKSGDLVEMFDEDGDDKLSREERKKFFLVGDEGFVSRAKTEGLYGEDMIPAPAPEPSDPDDFDAAGGSDFDPSVRPEYKDRGTEGEPAAPPTTLDYANMMREAIGNEAIDIEERNDTLRTIRESMVKQKLTTPEEFNQIGRQMLEEAPARKAAAHVAYLRSPEGSDWVDAPGLDKLAALQKAPFGRGTALEGSVGGLKDPSRQLESKGGRLRRLARELEGKGYRKEAGQARAAAPHRPLMSQRDRIALEEKKRAQAMKAEAARRREQEARPFIREGEENIKANIVS